MAGSECWYAELVAFIKARIDKESMMRRSERAKAAWAERKKRIAALKKTPPKSGINPKR
jgi:hypothetical protein